MKVKYIFIASLLLVTAETFCQSEKSDTLYFCREYKNGTEIGLSDYFSINPKGDSITVMVKTKGPINLSHVNIDVEKVLADTVKYISTHKFDVEPGWDYIFFAGINFYDEGLFRVSLVRTDKTIITSNLVNIIFKRDK